MRPLESDWTVLLLKPDYAADEFGHDTLELHVEAVTEACAVKAARKLAREIDETGEPEDYYCLFCARGVVHNLAYDGEVGRD